MQNFIIALDGASASGKGTLAKMLSDEFDCNYLPTGNGFRVVAKKFLSSNHPHPENISLQNIGQIKLDDYYDNSLNSELIGVLASKIATRPDVREFLAKFQREWAYSKQKNNIVILEGRDIGTVICPEANVKIFLQASAEARAKRRYQQLLLSGAKDSYETILEKLIERDARDSSREIAPLKPADDAFIVDNSNLSIEETFNKIAEHVRNILKANKN